MSEQNYNHNLLAAVDEMRRKYESAPKMTHEEMTQALFRALELGKQVERRRVLSIIKQAQLEAMTVNNGYTRDVAEAFGQSWPLQTGWKKKLIDRINEVEDE
jgi:hypothetical protein